MKVCLIGCGKAGTLHLERWLLLKCDIIIIDNDPDVHKRSQGFLVYEKIDDVPIQVIREVDIVDVCLPTSLHLSCILKILKYNSRANILVEKPLCDIDQIKVFKQQIDVRSNNIQCNIIVNDPYSFSYPIRDSITFIEKNCMKNDIKHIYIEFSKNRVFDEKNGRFIDVKSGALGYEWFHMLSILSLFLQKHEMKDYLKSPVDLHAFSFAMNLQGLQDNIEETITISSHKKVTLYTSMQGSIKYPLNYFYSKNVLPSFLLDLNHSNNINYGDNRKYRAIHIILKEAYISVLLGYTGYNPNNHLILYRTKDSLKFFPIFQDHMLDSIKYSFSCFKNGFKNKSVIKALEFENRILNVTRFMRNITTEKKGYEDDNSLNEKYV